MPEVHVLKVWPAQFQQLRDGYKRADFRREDDRHFQVNDIVVFREYTPTKEEWNAVFDERQFPFVNEDFGRASGFSSRDPLIFRVLHVQHDFGIPEGYAVLSLGAYEADF